MRIFRALAKWWMEMEDEVDYDYDGPLSRYEARVVETDEEDDIDETA